MNGWPATVPLDASNTTLKIKTLKEHCWDIIQYGLANRSCQAPASYVVQFALTIHSAFEEVEDTWQQSAQRQATDHLREAQIRLEQTTKSLVAAVATSTNRAEDGTQERSIGSAKTPHLSIPSWTPGGEEPSESDLQIRLRWKDRTASPYRITPPNVILKTVNGILEKTDNPSLYSIQVAAVRKLKSGDLDLYTHSVLERERLLHNSGDWLAQLEKGHAVRVMDKQYAVLAHSISFEFYPKSRAMAEAKEEVLRSNPGRFPNAEIVHLGWASGFNDKTSKKSSSSLIIAFGDPRHANQAIQEGIFLRGALVRTELYDPGCRVVQCSRCYHFGHVAAMCSSTAACPYCTLAHGRKQCPNRKNTTRYKCAICQGPHAANDRRQCPNWIEQNEALIKVKQKKARLFPVPLPSPPNAVTPAPNSTAPDQRQSALVSADTASDPEALSETGAAPPSRVQAEGSSARGPPSRDPLDDNLPSFGKSDKPQTVRQHFRKRITTQLLNNRRRLTATTATTSTPNPADPVWSSSVPTEMPQVATQGEKGQSSQPASSVTPRTTLLSTNLPDTAPSILAQSNTSSARGTLQQTSKDSLRQVNSQSKTSKPPSTLGTRKRAYGVKSPLGKRPRLENGSSTLGRDDGTTDELESEAESDSESVTKIFSRTPSKRTIKTTKGFYEAQATLRKALPPPKLGGKGSNARSHFGRNDGRADAT
jgi:hypothetical protein